MNRTVAPGLVLALAWAPPAVAAELELGVTTGVVYDDNVFSSTTDPQDDYSGQLGPRFRILDETGSLTWDVHYWPVYEKYLHLDEADDWDHDFYANVTWMPSPRTTVQLIDRYIDSSNVSAAFVQQAPEPFIEPVLQVGTNRVSVNQLSLSLSHMLTARSDVSLSLARYDTDYGTGLDSEVTSVGASYSYALTPVDYVGFSLSAVDQDIGIEPTYFYNGSLQWIHRFSPTLSLDASAGPAFVDEPEPDFPAVIPGRVRFPSIRTPESPPGVTPIRASSCGPAEGGLRVLDAACEPFPPGTFEPLELVPFLLQEIDLPRIGDEPTIDPTITYFAAISLTKRWDDFLFTLSYNRDASTTSQIGGLVSDTFSLAVSWYPPARPWRVNFYGSFGQREFPGEGFGLESLVRSSSIAGVSDVAESVGFRLIEVDRSQTLDIYQAGLYVAYDIAPRTQLYMNLTWERNEFDIEFQDAADRRWDRTRIAIGIIYTFPRINLPNLPI